MSDSQNLPVDRIRIFSRDGVPLAEFKASISRSHVLGGEGRAEWQYPTRKSDVVNDDVLRFGNWLLITSTHLPPWIGIIDSPRSWSTRTVTISAYTPERLFKYRIGPPEEIVTGSAGTIFNYLISILNSKEQTILRAGAIWRGGTQRQETLNPSPLSEDLKRLWERSGEDYAWVPSVGADGRLTVLGNWLQVLGADTGALLHEGRGGGNVEAVGRILIEDGPIVNSVLAYGEGETWRSKPSVTVTQQNSIGKYGLREASEEYQGVLSTTTLRSNGAQLLNESYRPRRSFALNALNVGDTFQYIRPGNILNLQLQNAGFQAGKLGYRTRVRIIGMNYNPDMRNKLQLIAREVTE